MRCRAPPARSAAALWGAPWRAAVIPVRAGLRAAPRRRLCAAPKAPAAEAPAKPPAAPKPGTGLPRVAAQGSGGKADGTPTQSQGPITWKNFLLAMSLGGSITLAFKYMEMRLAEDRFRSVGKAALGGPFELLDQDGEPCSDVDLHGGWALLYFGFTFCPDICPNELQKITAVVRPPPLPAVPQRRATTDGLRAGVGHRQHVVGGADPAACADHGRPSPRLRAEDEGLHQAIPPTLHR